MTYHHPPDAAPLAVPYQAVTNDNNNNNNSSSAFNATETGQQGQDGGVYTISPGSSVTLPVACVCGEKARCACEEVHDEAYAKTVLEDAAKSDSSGGGGGMQDKAVLRVINDTMTLVVNGSVPDTSAAVGASEQAGLWLWMMVAVAAAAAAVGLV